MRHRLALVRILAAGCGSASKVGELVLTGDDLTVRTRPSSLPASSPASTPIRVIGMWVRHILGDRPDQQKMADILLGLRTDAPR